MAEIDNELLDEMLGDFLDEADGLLAQLGQNLLVLDEWAKRHGDQPGARCDERTLNEMFRAAHSLKGLSAMLRLADINLLTHKIENIFDAARQNKLAVRTQVVDLVFLGVDRLHAMIDRLRDPSSDPVDATEVIESIAKFLDAQNADKSLGDQASADAALEELLNRSPIERPEAMEETPKVPHRFGVVADEAEIASNYLVIFVDETDRALEELSDKLLGPVDGRTIDDLLVLCHRIKGSAAAIGLRRCARLAHRMEDVLQERQLSRGSLDSGVTDGLLACVDALRSYVENRRRGENEPDEFEAVFDRLVSAHETLLGDVASTRTPSSNRPTESSAPASIAAIAATAPEGVASFAVFVAFEPGLQLAELKALVIYERAADAGSPFYYSPTEAELERATDVRCVTLGIAGASEEAIRRQLSIDGVARIDVQPVHRAIADSNALPTGGERVAASEISPDEAAGSSQGARSKPAETVRVDVERLDELMNLTGQLVINKARFVRIHEGFRPLTKVKRLTQSLGDAMSRLDRIDRDLEAARGADAGKRLSESVGVQVRQLRKTLEAVEKQIEQIADAKTAIGDLGQAVHQLDRIAEGMQKSVMETRMVPIGPLFNRFKRVVRDLTRTVAKEVRLEIRGENAELDKRMIDELGDPLIHMIRNSVDHGVESPANRVAAGKSAHGTVTLDAFHRGNRIVIQIVDDGRGLDPAKIRAKAVAKGLLSQADADKLSLHEVFQLIWEPGFSTAEKITEVSGRGMGMDIVRSKIEELNGTVELESESGVGTRFTIRLPLTMAILPSLLAEIDGDVFALPIESVTEIVRVPKKDLATVRGRLTVQVRERTISVARLDEVYDWSRPTPHRPIENEATLVVIGAEGREVGLLVHGLLGEEDVVITSLAENFRNVDGIAGASILGDGRVSLILDVSALLDLTARPRVGRPPVVDAPLLISC